MSLLDMILILFFLMFIVVGFKNGVIREMASLLGVIIVFFLAYTLKGFVGDLFCMIFPFFSFSGVLEGISAINILFYQMIAFLLLFSILLGIYGIVFKISKVLQKIVNFTIILWLPSKLLGGVIGAVKGYFVILVGLLVFIVPFQNSEFFKESKISSWILYQTPFVSHYTKEFTSSVEEIYQLGEEVTKKSITKEEANLKTLDLLLKYKMVSKSTVEKLIKAHKLDSISNYESVLAKY